MPEMLLQDLLRWTGAEMLNRSPDFADPRCRLDGICSDSRAIRRGCLFIALCGEHFNGHDFLTQAVAQGAGGLLISDRSAWQDLGGKASGTQSAEEQHNLAGLPVLLVADTLKALQAIASGYRDRLTAPVVAITGSVGKTTTRQMISACLQPVLQVHQTAGNLNNEIGLPQTLLQAGPDDQVIVLEMGMRGPGEIALLSRIARPDIAVITCIGWSHIGRLGSQSAIMSAKAEILAGMKPEGLLMLNGDDPLLLDLGCSHAGHRRLAYITTGSDPAAVSRLIAAGAEFVLCAGSIVNTGTDVSFTAIYHVPGRAPLQVPVHLPFPGLHHVRNALFGLSAAHALQVDPFRAAAGAAGCRNTGSRQHLIRIGPAVLMDDTYNAAPESMQAALETLAGMAGTGHRKLAAIGCMLELGDFAAEAHRQVGELAARLGYELLLVIGPQAEDLLVGARSVRPDLPSCVCADLDDMTNRLLSTLKAGDHLLIKGSRAFGMEQVSRSLKRQLEPVAPDEAPSPDEPEQSAAAKELMQ